MYNKTSKKQKISFLLSSYVSSRHLVVFINLLCPAILFIAVLTFIPFHPSSAQDTPAPQQTGESFLVKELKNAVEDYGYKIQLLVWPNQKTNKNDIYITPEKGYDYASDKFIFDACQGIAEVTSESVAYRLYVGIVLIEVTHELWAIGSENCRKAFRMDTGEEQKALLQKYLKLLR